MVYAPQRRHAVASLASTVQALAVLQQFYSPNILILISRLLAQAQISVAPFAHPSRSLLLLFLLATSVNGSAVFLHFLDFWAEMQGSKGLVLDFVGQAHPASLTRILLLDLAMYLLQVIALTVSYITNHASNIPKSGVFPYDDLLLPPSGTGALETGDEGDLVSQLRRRKGKGRASIEDEESALWLDEDEDVAMSAAPASASLLGHGGVRSHRREPPLIFSLSLPHLINLIFRLPAPPGAPSLTSGGTPLASPLATPSAEISNPTSSFSPRLPRPPRSRTSIDAPQTPLRSNTAHARADLETDEEDEDEDSGHESRRGAAGLMPSLPGRIPGDYWASLPTTDR